MSQSISHTNEGVAPVGVEEFLFPYLAYRKNPATPGRLSTWLSNYTTRAEIDGALASLTDRGLIRWDADNPRLTSTGEEKELREYGQKLDEKRCKNVVWPALALGLDPSSKAASRLRTPSTLAAVTLISLYGLPLDPEAATLNHAACSLALRGLAGRVDLAEPHPAVRVVARELGELSQTERLRPLLIRAALELGRRSGDAAAAPADADADLREFARRVQTVTDALSTPPFSDAVAVGQVYDAYGRRYPDAGGLDAFKRRLLDAHKSNHLTLITLDRPEALERELRDRSEIRGERFRFHFVSRHEKS